jgi:WXG100 family type VII secretion target
MAQNITVGYEGLQQAATQLRNGRTELNNTLKDLQAVINSLTSTGFKTRVASGKFGQYYRQWDQSTNQLISSLDDISRAIQDAQTKHEQTDQSLAEGVGGIGGGGGGGAG